MILWRRCHERRLRRRSEPDRRLASDRSHLRDRRARGSDTRRRRRSSGSAATTRTGSTQCSTCRSRSDDRHQEEIRHDDIRRSLRSRQAANGHGLSARARASAAHARQLQGSALRRRAVGARGAEGSLRLRAQDAGTRHRSARAARSARGDARNEGRPQVRARSAHHGEHRRRRNGERDPAVARRVACAQARRLSDRRHCGIGPPGQRSDERHDGSIRWHRVRAAADSEHAFPARSVVLDLRRCNGQSDVLAGAPAGNAAAAGRVQVPPAVYARRFQDLVGRLGRGLRRGVARRRRRDADR